MTETMAERVMVSPASGVALARRLFAAFNSSTELDEQRKILLRQMLVNLCSNAAAIRYTQDAQANSWKAFYDELVKEAGVDEAEKIFLGTLPTATKSSVNTPHPTEMLATRAIRNYNEIMDFLLTPEADDLFTSKRIDSEHPVVKKIGELWKNLISPTGNLKIDHEMTRSIRASERSWDAIEVQMATASKILGFDKKYKGKGQYVPMEVLEAFYYTNESFTWTPGDQDSKPDMTEDLFPAGIEKNKAAMWLRYMKALADIASILPDGSPEEKEIHSLMWKIMDTVDAISAESAQGKDQDYLKQYFDREVRSMPNGDVALQEISHIMKLRKNPDVTYESFFQENVGGKKVPFDYREGGYKSAVDFQSDLVELKTRLEGEGKSLPKHKDHKGEETGFTVLDVLLSQVANFRVMATRIQVRQNRETHEKVLNTILKDLHSFDYIRKADMTVPDLLDLIADPNTGELTEDGREISSHIRNRIYGLRREVQKMQVDEDGKKRSYKDFSDLEKEKFLAYQTMMTVQHAIENPDAIPKYIVAECRDANDALTPLLFMKLMHDPKKAKKIDGYGLVETFPLFEYREHITNAKNVLAEIDENPHARSHKQRIQDSLVVNPKIPGVMEYGSRELHIDPALSFYDRKNGETRRLTVADAKMMHGLEVKEGDDKKLIEHRQTVMVAGSDSRKGHGPFITPLIKYSIADSLEEMLDRGVLVEFFMGAGGGKHRSYPSSAQMHTDQGSNNRHLTAEEIAYNNMRFLSRHMRAMAGHGVKADTQKQIEEITARSLAACKIYESLYASSDFSEYASRGTDCHIASLISFAARPSTRTRSSEGEGEAYPAKVDVKNFRAIQFGAAMNGAGVTLGMWYGVSAFLGVSNDGKIINDGNKDKLIKLYKSTVTAQHAIDDAAYGLSLVDMDVAWKFLGCTRVDGDKVRMKDGTEKEISDLANGWEATEACAIHALAKIDWEYQKSARAIHEFYMTMKNGRYTDADSKQFKPENIVDVLPAALRDEVQATMQQVAPAREELAKIHLELKSGSITMPKKGMSKDNPNYTENSKALTRMWAPFTTIMEAFEHTPAAMRFKEYGQAIGAPQRQL